MSLDGMDVDQAQRLAERLDANAQALNRIAAMLAALITELGHYWRGSASATFQQRWTAQYHPVLSDAAVALTDMHTHLVANIRQQIQASAADPGQGQALGIGTGLTLAGLMGGAGRLWQVAQKIDGYTSLVTTPWERFVQLDSESTLLKYEQSPILQWMHDSPHVQQADDILKNAHATVVLDQLDKVGTGMTYLSMGASGAAAAQAISQHHFASAGGDFIDLTATGLKNSKDPVLYLAGFDVSLFQKDYELGRQVQWNAIPDPFNAANFKNDYIPAFKSLPGQLVSTLSEII